MRLLKRSNQTLEDEVTSVKIKIETSNAMNTEKDARIAEFKKNVTKQSTENDKLV